MHKELPIKADITEFVPAIRMILSENELKVCRLRHNELNTKYSANILELKNALSKEPSKQFIHWDGKYIFLEDTSSPEKILKCFSRELAGFKKNNSSLPKIIVIKDYGILASENNSVQAELILDEFEAFLDSSAKNSPGTKDFSKSKLNENQAESQKESGYSHHNILSQRICVVTGGAQGFGEGISRSLVELNANLIIADLNEEKGMLTTEELKKLSSRNDLAFVKTDVSNPESVKNLVFETVKNFGGIDVFISNAGILMAGGLDEMEPSSFELMTRVNYEGYFLCAKYASSVMKLQSKYKEEYFSDIIQINSKSGLKGSNRNFAYSGGKFGGIGLTQSFALELAPFRIKVNAICPGNFFDGPLWTDPKKGLFVQYLKAGKVPGAKTIADIKNYYEKRVPMGRGCKVGDVMKALEYIVSQEYETGQAVPVTGGQEMMS